MKENKAHLDKNTLFLLKDASKIRIATVIGSTKQKEAFLKVDEELTRKGFAVFSCSVWDPPDKEEIRPIIEKAYIKKIDLCDVVACIFKPDGSLGEHAQKELNLAKKLQKIIYYYDSTGMFIKSLSDLNPDYFEGMYKR